MAFLTNLKRKKRPPTTKRRTRTPGTKKPNQKKQRNSGAQYSAKSRPRYRFYLLIFVVDLKAEGLSRLIARHLDAFLARFGKPNRNRLFAALDRMFLCMLARTHVMHLCTDLFAGFFSVLAAAGFFLCTGFLPCCHELSPFHDETSGSNERLGRRRCESYDLAAAMIAPTTVTIGVRIKTSCRHTNVVTALTSVTP